MTMKRASSWCAGEESDFWSASSSGTLRYVPYVSGPEPMPTGYQRARAEYVPGPRAACGRLIRPVLRGHGDRVGRSLHEVGDHVLEASRLLGLTGPELREGGRRAVGGLAQPVDLRLALAREGVDLRTQRGDARFRLRLERLDLALLRLQEEVGRAVAEHAVSDDVGERHARRVEGGQHRTDLHLAGQRGEALAVEDVHELVDAVAALG